MPTWVTDHPRIRGEHGNTSYKGKCEQGSSPHTRGARDDFLGDGFAAGIIPAYAGSTWMPLFGGDGRKDHPRIRGEHGNTSYKGKCEQGSSPHTRGALLDGDDSYRAVRIIPAYAGSTVRRAVVIWLCRDHPRIRGEHTSTAGAKGISQGSSPHTRGAQHH